MDFWGTILVVFRRWYVALPAFLLVVGGTAAIYAFVPTPYTSISVLMVAVPNRAGGGQVNPLLSPYGDTSTTTAALLVQSLNTPQMADEFRAIAGPGTSVKVVNGAGNSELLNTGPYLFIVAESTSPTMSLQVVEAVVDHARDQLATLQMSLKAPRKSYVTLADIVAPTMQPSGNGSIRSAISALALGLMISLASVYAAESVSVARRRRQLERTGCGPVGTADRSEWEEFYLVRSGEGRWPGGEK